MHPLGSATCKISDRPLTTRKAFYVQYFERPAVAESISRGWKHIVADYSETKLTRASDKLLAMAGLVYGIRVVVNLTYAFGHWIENMPAELLWRAQKPGRRIPGSAPTWAWAWASIDGVRICNEFYQSFEPHIRVTRPPDPCAPLESLASETEPERFNIELEALTIRGHLHPNTATDREPSNRHTFISNHSQPQQINFSPDICPFPSSSDDKLDDFECVLMTSGTHGYLTDVSYDVAELLVLRRLGKVSAVGIDRYCRMPCSLYERVGYARLYNEAAHESLRVFSQQKPRTIVIS